MSLEDIPEEILAELRYQEETKFRYALYKRPEFPFLQSVGVKDIFHSCMVKDYGFIGCLHLQYTVDKNTGAYWKSSWKTEIDRVIAIAEDIQNKKIINEDRVIDYHLHYMDMVYGRKQTGIVMLS